MADLAGRVAMVTGGTRGIGLATVRALAAWGATVVLTGRDPETATIRAAAVAADVGAEVAGIGLDVNDEEAVQAAFRRTAKRYGRIDALVAAAGTLEAAPIGMMAREHVERMLATNVSGTLASLRAATQVWSASARGRSCCSAPSPGSTARWGRPRTRRRSRQLPERPGRPPGSWAGTASG